MPFIGTKLPNYTILASDRETDRETRRPTDGDEYAIVAVDKPQL